MTIGQRSTLSGEPSPSPYWSVPCRPRSRRRTAPSAGSIRHVETHAWWLTTTGHQLWPSTVASGSRPTPSATGPDREVTGARVDQRLGEAALADGYDLRPAARRRFRPARCVRRRSRDLDADDPAAARRPRGSWQTPTREFFDRLPRDPESLINGSAREHGVGWPVRDGSRPAHVSRARGPARGAVPGAGLPARRRARRASRTVTASRPRSSTTPGAPAPS
jgi:hypothetical protein